MTKVYNKLVRDKIPDIIRENGENPKIIILDDEAYLRELVRKLDEEIAEFKADLSLEELADVQEVLLALADRLASRRELETVRVKKVAARGAFEKRIFLKQVS